MSARISITTCTIALVAITGGATATDGNLYTQGATPFSTGAGVTTTQPAPSVVQVTATATNAAPTGITWSMGWGCPVPGSEIASVSWSALRYAAPSSAGVQVTSNGARLWAEGDSGMPRSPAGGRGYGVSLPGGICDLRLEMVQRERRQQHARVWWIGSPSVVVRDVTAPAASITSTPANWVPGGQGSLRVAWQATDNFASDGIAGQRVQLSGEVRWAGTPGQGQHAVDIPLDGVPDGTHRIRVEVDGDGTGAAAAESTVRIDRTGPETGEVTTTYPPGSTKPEVSWSATDVTSGLQISAAEVNTAVDGSQAGAWVTAGAAGPASAGLRVTRTVGSGLADGVHTWRVTARDVAGNVTQQPAPDRLVVDTTPPTIDMQPIPSAWTSTLPLDVMLRDNLDGVLGLGDLDVEVNTAADGTANGEWVLMIHQAATPGRDVMAVPLVGLGDGLHLVRLRLHNGGPFSQVLVATRLGLVRTDLTPPDLARAVLTAMSDGRVRMTWSADDARSGIATVRLQWLDGETWRTVIERPASNGSGIVTLDPALVPDPTARMRVQVTDVAGNTRGMEMDPAPVQRPGGPSGPAGQMATEAREGLLNLGLTNADLETVEGQQYRVATLRAGDTVTVTGRLTNAQGQPLSGFTMVARQDARDLAVGITGPGGSFALQVTPTRSGPIDVGVPDGTTVIPVPTGPAIAVRLRATVTLMASSHSAVAKGTPVVFTGRMLPAPGTVGGRKAIVLEWLDPFRKVWRPVVNARANADGTFRVPWRFQASGLTVPFRVRVPRERGWFIEPAISRIVVVRVR